MMKLSILFETDLGPETTCLFRYPPPQQIIPLPVEAVDAATNVFTEYVFCESVEREQTIYECQKTNFLLKLVKVNKQVFAITLLNRNLNHNAQLSIS